MTFLMSLYNWSKCEDYFSCLRHKDNLSEEIRHRFYEALHINVTRSREKNLYYEVHRIFKQLDWSRLPWKVLSKSPAISRNILTLNIYRDRASNMSLGNFSHFHRAHWKSFFLVPTWICPLQFKIISPVITGRIKNLCPCLFYKPLLNTERLQ